MKGMNLKKTGLFTVLSLSLLISSCGGGSSENVESTEGEKVVTCDCEEDISWDKGVGYLHGRDKFTGTCEEKNEKDEVIKRIEVKNGFKLHLEKWETVDKKLVQTMDMKYVDNEKNEGYEFEVKSDIKKTFTYLNKYEEFKDGRSILRYSIIDNKSDFGISTEYYSVLSLERDGNNIDVDCRYDGQLYGDDYSDKVDEFFKCVKGQNLPKFFFTKM